MTLEQAIEMLKTEHEKANPTKKKTHYQAILDMAIKDRKVLPNG